MEQQTNGTFVLPEPPWPEMRRRVDMILDDVRVRCAFGHSISRARSKAGAGEMSGRDYAAAAAKGLSEQEKDRIRRSTAKPELLALYHNVEVETITALKAEAVGAAKTA